MSDGGVLAVGLADGGPALSGARDGALMAFCRDGSAANRYGGDVSMGEAPPPPNPNFDFSFPVELAGRRASRSTGTAGDDADWPRSRSATTPHPRNQLGVVVFVQNAMGSVEGGGAAAAPPPSQLSDAQKADMVNQVVNMGVDVEQAYAALEKTNYASVELALSTIFGS
ncbi:hypothetical protein JL720_13047 [Aureococcus anophagefferens]|nr:hypothetical protein JL720_13047 [Aureococcus anophagefferens]